MFREMRRKNQLLSMEDTIAVMERGTNGILAVSGDDDYPYTVPLSYVYANEKIYFHCAKVGHKIDGIKKNPKVTFCVVDQDEIIPEKYTTYFRSVVAFGQARILDDLAEIRKAAEIIALKYSPDYKEGIPAEIDSSMAALCIVEISIDHLTGKEAIELVRARQK